MDDIVTLFYMKKSGVIRCFCSGKQTLDYYGEEKQDIEEIMDFIYVKFDDFLLKNIDHYRIKNGQVELTKDGNIEVLEGGE